MIAQIKVLANAKEIESAQIEYKETAQKNHDIEKSNSQLAKARRIDLLPYPIIPEQEYKPSDLLIDANHVTLAFVNSNGEISIKYQGDNFNLIYSDEVWNKLLFRFGAVLDSKTVEYVQVDNNLNVVSSSKEVNDYYNK